MTLRFRGNQFAREALARKKAKEQHQRKRKRNSLTNKTKKFLKSKNYKLSPEIDGY